MLCFQNLGSSLVAAFLVISLWPGLNAIDPVFDLPHRGCYFPNWSQYRTGTGKYTASNINPNLCTYINLAFGTVVNNALQTLEYNDVDTFKTLVAFKATNPNLKILLSVGGWTLTTPLVTMAASSASRSAFISSAVTNLRQWGLDGLDVDWEFPNAGNMQQYSALLTELRAAFEAESTQTGKPRLALTAAVHLISDGGFDGAVINTVLDIANVMTYDLDGTWDLTRVGHEAPLFLGPFGTASDLNVASIMQSWVQAGVSKSKLVIGLPLYGRGWVLANSAQHGLGAPATAAIPAGPYTATAGVWAFFEICQSIQSNNAVKVFDTNIQASYAYTNTWWMGYDDVQTITAKCQWAKNNGYGGVFVWDLSQDDFANTCGAGAYPLLTAIQQTLAPSGTPSATTSQPSGTTTVAPVPTTTQGSSQTMTTTNFSSPVCNSAFCQLTGSGSFALGGCLNNYCDCISNIAYPRRCASALMFDSVHKVCNWTWAISACN